MLNLELLAEHLAIAEVAKSIATELISPAARDAEAARAVPTTVWKAVLDTGLAHPVAEERGGGGVADTLTHLLAVANLSYGDAGIALAIAWSGAAAYLLGRHGGPGLDDRVRRLCTDPSARAAVAVYEGYGRGPAEYETKVRVSGQSVSVTGRKVGVPFAREAETIIVVGTDFEFGGLRAVAVPADTPGVVVGDTLGGLGLDAAAMSSINFDIELGVDTLVGGPELDRQALAHTVERIRLLMVAAAIGTAHRAIDYAAGYAVDRVAFGRPIAGFQGISFPLADAQVRVTELRYEMADLAVRLEDETLVDHSAAVSALIAYAGEVVAESTRTAVQTLGGHGFITDHPVELWYRTGAALAALDFDSNRSSFQPAL